MPLDLGQCDAACTQCIFGYKGKFSKEEIKGKFHIECTGIPKSYSNVSLPLLDQTGLSAEALLDPVTWAAEVLDWHCLDPNGAIWRRKTDDGTYILDQAPAFDANNPNDVRKALGGKSPYHRPYQALVLRCSSKRKVLRLGRQCIRGDSFIYASNGPVRARDVQEGQKLLGGDVAFVGNHLDKIYKITFANGVSLEVNGEHPFYTQRGWAPTKDLNIQDKVEFLSSKDVSISQNIEQETPLDPELAKFLGYLLSDGYWGFHQSVKFTNNNQDLLDEVAGIAARRFGVVPKFRTKGNGFDLHLTMKHGTNKHNPIDLYLQDLGVWEKRSFGRILTASNEALEAFVAGYFNGDGYLWHYERPDRPGQYRADIGFAIGLSEQKAYEFQYILWRLGIGTRVKSEWMKKSTGPFYRVITSRKGDQVRLLQILDRRKYPGKFEEHAFCLDKIGNHTEDEERFSNVAKIEEKGEDLVYSWETTSGEIIGPLGMRTHNSGKTEVLVVNALYNALTKSNFSVVVLAPYQTQIVLFWKKLENKIGRSPILSTSVKRSVKAPNFTIDFYNGSSISGFTAATKSGGNADAVRGQTAGLLIFDEGDYLADGDIVSAMSVVANQPDAAVWISSTPTGKRGYFYNTCHSPLWKEYHFPSWANPNWSDETEAFFRDSLVGMGWTHEIEAEFGEQEEGVFQNVFVEAAQADYVYSLMGREPHWTYCMGVDWNLDKVGTTICIVGWDPVAHKFSVVHRDVVRREGSTQIAACDKIIELNRVWRPAWIYVDAGAGTMQIETLHKIGLDARRGRGLEHPDAILATSVVAYNFSSKIEITDPFTKEKTQKPAKPFLVENTVRKFERGEVRYSAVDKQLTAELLSYVVDRRTPAGIPVYKASIEDVGDHNLDAFMLALVAFTLKLSNLNRVTYDSHVAFAFSPLRRIVEQAGKREDKEEQVSSGKQVPLLKELVAKQKPHSDRAAVLERSPLTLGRNLPAANTSTPRRIWSWPGFMRDEPPPTRSRRSGGRPSRAGF